MKHGKYLLRHCLEKDGIVSSTSTMDTAKPRSGVHLCQQTLGMVVVSITCAGPASHDETDLASIQCVKANAAI